MFIDTTSPVIRSLTITDITETGFSLHHRVTDNGTLAGLSVTLTSDTGETLSSFLVTDGESDFPWSAEGLTEGVWTISVTASDAAWKREPLHVRLEIYRRDRAPRSHRRPPRARRNAKV